MRGFLGILFLCSGHWLSAQLYFGGGYQYASGAYELINSAVEKYNSYRPQQFDPLDALSELHGPSLSLGVGLGGQSINLDVAFLGATLDASNIRNGERFDTELDISQTSASLVFGAFPEPGDGFALGIGGALVYSYTTVRLTTNDPELGVQAQAPIDQYNALGFAPTVQTFVGLNDFLFFYFKPSYLIDLFDNDTYTLHKALNPNNYQNDEQGEFTGRFSGLQLQAGLVINFSGF
mgnify:CR=1 FL=1